MTALRTALTSLLICTIAVGGAACTSIRTIRPATEPGKPAYSSIKAGDKVTLHLSDGRRLDIRVSQVDTEGIVSMEGIRYLRKDIARLERRSVSVAKTTALVAGVALGAFVIAGILIASALDGFLGGG